MVSRVYVEKKPGFDGEAKSLERELRGLLEDLAQDGILHSRAIRSTLERMGSSSAS